jgi:hypothetical protein
MMSDVDDLQENFEAIQAGKRPKSAAAPKADKKHPDAPKPPAKPKQESASLPEPKPDPGVFLQPQPMQVCVVSCLNRRFLF